MAKLIDLNQYENIMWPILCATNIIKLPEGYFVSGEFHGA